MTRGLITAETVPAGVVEVCRVLKGAGFDAYAVGGAVRDTLLQRPVGDWDVTTSAHPDEVAELFDRVIPTGVKHGTVTVIVGRGRRRMTIEVTAFRGEGAYSDGRRPDEVEFGVSLQEDLARRDFVMNAIAYDPIDQQIVDPFGGVGDIEKRLIRAVGAAERRFAEDGLRIMRAVRFAAQLEFAVDQETEDAIPRAVANLANVSRERVSEELWRLLGADRPSIGLSVALRTGIVDNVLPELSSRDDALWRRILDEIDRCEGDAVVRCALLLAGDPTPGASDASERAERIARRLKWSNADRGRCIALVRFGHPARWREADAAGMRRLLRAVGKPYAPDIPLLLRAWGDEKVAAQVEGIIDRGEALEVGDLAVRGRDLIAELGAKPGPWLGEVLDGLLERVLDDPTLNERERLLELAAEARAQAADSEV